MCKKNIHIGGAYRRNPEREARLSGFAPGVPSRGETEVPDFEREQGSEAARVLEFLAVSFEKLMGDPKEIERLQKDPQAREALVNLTKVFQGVNDRLGQVENHAAYQTFSTDGMSRRYMRERASLEGEMARQRNDYVSVGGGLGRNEALAQGLGSHDVLRVHGDRHRIKLPENGTDDEIFAVVREAEKAYQREYTAILHKWAAIRNRCNKRRVFEERKQELTDFYTKSDLYKQFVDVRDRAEERTERSYQEYKEQKRRENPPVSVRAPDGRRVGIIDRETGSGAWSPLVTKEQMLQWASLPGEMRGDVKYVTVDPGDEFMEKHLSPEEQADVLRHGRDKNWINNLRARRAVRNRTLKRELSSPTTPQDFARGYTTVNGERRPLHPSSGYGGSQYPPDYSDHPDYDYRRDPRFSQSTINHISRQGGDRYMQTQLRLGRMYGDEIADRLNSGEWNDLAADPRFAQKYQHVMNVLQRRSRHMWPRQPDQRYGDLAWARSQLEAMQKARRQLDEMDENITGKTLRVLEFPIRGLVHDAGMSIIVPKEYRLEGEDGIIAINDPRAWGEGPFWHGRGETYAHEAGIRVRKILNVDGSVRGIRVEFTQPGIYEVNGQRVVVARSSGKTLADEAVSGEAKKEEEEVETAIREKRSKGFEVNFGRHKPRDFWIKKNDQAPFMVNPHPPEGKDTVIVREGIKIVRTPGPDYNFEVYFTKPGYYEFQAYDRNGRLIPGSKEKITVPPAQSSL